jgi:hypothetical protein
MGAQPHESDLHHHTSPAKKCQAAKSCLRGATASHREGWVEVCFFISPYINPFWVQDLELQPSVSTVLASIQQPRKY